MIIKRGVNWIVRKCSSYKWKEKKVINQKADNDETLFVVRRATSYNGIASHIIVFMGMLKYMREKYKGAVPVIDMKNYPQSISETDGNAWEVFFEQPAGLGVDRIPKAKYVVYSDGYYKPGKYSIPECWSYEEAQKEGWDVIFNQYFKIKEELLERFETEWKEITYSYKYIIGVKARGTDYNSKKPKGHNIQPSFEQLCQKIDEALKYKENAGILFASEDWNLIDKAIERYGNRIIRNKRMKMDYVSGSIITENYKEKTEATTIYLKELYFLSKCNCFISGKNSGVIPIILWNSGKFKNVEIMDLGKYE